MAGNIEEMVKPVEFDLAGVENTSLNAVISFIGNPVLNDDGSVFLRGNPGFNLLDKNSRKRYTCFVKNSVLLNIGDEVKLVIRKIKPNRIIYVTPRIEIGDEFHSEILKGARQHFDFYCRFNDYSVFVKPRKFGGCYPKIERVYRLRAKIVRNHKNVEAMALSSVGDKKYAENEYRIFRNRDNS